MERELRLSQLKLAGQVADATLPLPERLDHPHADGVSQSPQQQLGLLENQGLRTVPRATTGSTGSRCLGIQGQSGRRERGERHVTGITVFIKPS